MDLLQLLKQMLLERIFAGIATNPLAQFGTTTRQYLGATLLPERLVPRNEYTEEGVRYRTVIANSGTRYSPVQKKGANALIGSMKVELGESDIGSEFTGQDYDALIDILGRGDAMAAQAQLIRWADNTLNLPLTELNELQRWEAIITGQTVRRGDNGYQELVQYPNPTGHRVTVAGQWSSDAYDPFDDIYAGVDFLAGKGYTLNRIITARPVVSKLAKNAKVRQRAGTVVVNAAPGGGTLSTSAGRVTLGVINGLLGDDGLPPIEQYDLQYRTQTGSGFFFPRDAFLMVATTGRQEIIDGEQPVVVPDTLGYVGVGRATGQAGPGRVIRTEAFDNKPPRIEGEAWQTALPVLLDPEALLAYTGIS